MDRAVIEYRKRRQMRIDARHRMDDEEESNQKNVGKKGGHGNTKLPFGLCQREGIEIGSGWTPRDAWNALADKGITPKEEFNKRKGKSTFKSIYGTEYSNIFAEKGSGDTYTLKGDFSMGGREMKKAKYTDFINKDEMYAFLQEHGVNRFKDPDTGENVNPSKMKLPKTVAKVGERRYKDLSLGIRRDKTGRPYSGRGYAIAGQDFTGKRTVLKVFGSINEAKEYAKKIGCSDKDLRITDDYKKRVTPTIRT